MSLKELIGKIRYWYMKIKDLEWTKQQEKRVTITKGDPKEYNIENTFVPLCKNKTFSVRSLVHMLRQGFVTISMMPDDVKPRVEKELIKRHPEILKKHPEIIKRHPEWKINSFSDNVLEESK